MELRSLIILLLSTIVFLSGCSTERNTHLTRSYHNLTSKYNIFFNGNESFKRGVEKAEKSFTDNYTRILPVFYFSNESVAQTVAPDMDRALAKATKVIVLHSITAKPEMKKGPVTQKQRDFYNKKEYNKWIDDNLLLMGKSYVYKRDFYLGLETFRRLITDFPGEPSRFEALIWMARAYNEMKEYREAERILMLLEADRDMPTKLKSDLYISFGDLYIKQKNYEKAFPFVEKALTFTRGKKPAIRYSYILAQLYEETGNYDKATRKYRDVIKMSPPYEMTFNAKINMAGTFRSGAEDEKNIRKQLRKMLRDEKNADYLDQVYYALGELEMKVGNEDEALRYYKLSVLNSKTNQFQKGQTYLTLGDYYFERKDYPLAQAYYDSSLQNLTIDYEKYSDLELKTASLTGLVENLRLYELEDSLQMLASLPEQQRINIVDNIIADVIRKEEEQRKSQSEENMDSQYAYMMASQGLTRGTQGDESGKWYFYNLNAKSFGQPEFRMKWGQRKLEDNWRRKNKQSVEFFDTQTALTQEEETVSQISVPVLNTKSREYYLQNIPVTDSMMAKSHERLSEALFNLGVIYRTDFNDKDKSAGSFEELLKRYPKGKYTLDTYYHLYELYASLNQPSKSQVYKNLLISEFPDSPKAKVLSDPGYVRQLEEERNREYKFYDETYTAYNRADYSLVIRNSDLALAGFNHTELFPRFRLLKALATGGLQGREAMKTEMEMLVADYPDHEVSAYAKEMIDFIYTSSPEIKIADIQIKAEEIYTFDPSPEHFFIIHTEKTTNINQLNFNIINFNLDNYNHLNLAIQREALGEGTLFIIKRFPDLSNGDRYREAFNYDKDVFRDVDVNKLKIFLITEENLKVLLEDKDVLKYLLFYDKFYEHRK